MPRKPAHDPSEWFGASRAAKLSDLSLAMVNYLCREGVVAPSCSCPRGHGTKRHYSFGDVVALRLVKRLSASGVSVLRLKGAMKQLRKYHPEISLTSLPGSHIVTDGKNLYLRRHGEPLESLVDGQFAFAFVVELEQLQSEVGRELQRLAKKAA